MIYTSIIGGKDLPRTDIKVCTDNRWFSNNRMAAKMYKVLPHLWWKEDTIWIDGNVTMKLSEQEALEKFLRDADMAVFKHPWRNHPWDEARCCEMLKFDEPIRLQQFMNHYGEEYLKSLPLHECNVILRRYNDATIRFNEHWWALICRWSQRDQVTFPIAVAETGIKLVEIEEGHNVRTHPAFTYGGHAPKKKPKE